MHFPQCTVGTCETVPPCLGLSLGTKDCVPWCWLSQEPPKCHLTRLVLSLALHSVVQVLLDSCLPIRKNWLLSQMVKPQNETHLQDSCTGCKHLLVSRWSWIGLGLRLARSVNPSVGLSSVRHLCKKAALTNLKKMVSD